MSFVVLYIFARLWYLQVARLYTVLAHIHTLFAFASIRSPEHLLQHILYWLLIFDNPPNLLRVWYCSPPMSPRQGNVQWVDVSSYHGGNLLSHRLLTINSSRVFEDLLQYLSLLHIWHEPLTTVFSEAHRTRVKHQDFSNNLSYEYSYKAESASLSSLWLLAMYALWSLYNTSVMAINPSPFAALPKALSGEYLVLSYQLQSSHAWSGSFASSVHSSRQSERTAGG